jgi:KipI family sensor histidine kinase inhibitor
MPSIMSPRGRARALQSAATVLPRFLAAADSALVVELGDEVSEAVSDAVLALDALLSARPPAGVLEVLPTLRSLLVEYDPLRTSQARLRGDLAALLDAGGGVVSHTAGAVHAIAVRYDGEDLAEVARRGGLSVSEVVRLHSKGEYRVAMLGNLPGLPYLVGLDARLQVPRRDDPRDAVEPGSVAVAGGLSCVYPVRGPGGWHVIGHTDARLFDALRTPPSLLKPGDVVRFVAADSGARVSADHGHNASSPGGADGPALEVVEPGLLTTVQDMGRRGWLRIGVPACGALDRELLEVANLLVGNDADAAALEVTHTGPVLRAAAPSVRVAVAGACVVTRIDREGGESDVGPWRSMVLREGEGVRVGRMREGLRCVVAVEGGVDVAPVLGSRSTYLRGGFGGLHGRPLRAGDSLPLRRAYAGHHPDVRLPTDTVHDAGLTASDRAIRVVPGPQDDAVTPESLAALVDSVLTVSPRSDRVGLRLDGLRLRHREAAEIISDGCAPGSIQVPGGGMPIVLLADRGTTGGYPKVATVASGDIPRLARLRPGDGLRLQPVTVAAAEALRRARQAELAALPAQLEPVGPL